MKSPAAQSQMINSSGHLNHYVFIILMWNFLTFLSGPQLLTKGDPFILKCGIRTVCRPPVRCKPSDLDLKIRYQPSPVKAFNLTRQLSF